ncbi:unnamed protein product [Nippostrongylus brasiliensis]|uniref:ABC transporter domain-containing protein n=1 Tax=Nippostrongylus brasiliensis TaxID=27835 RepID=A0A0N4YS79_NIPBR|nr:unnamed protein product [Nippostrongylus brasiliensis]
MQKTSRMEEADDGLGEADVVVEGVSKIWETTGTMAIRNVNLKAYRHQVTVFLGHNGSGKSTLFSLIGCSARPTTGQITIRGMNVEKKTAECQSIIGHCPQSSKVFSELTVLDHLWFFSELKDPYEDWHQEATELLTRLQFDELQNKKAGALCESDKRKLCVAIAFTGGCRVVLLDQPTMGMEPKAKRLTEELISNKKRYRCIFLSTHRMYEAETVGDRIHILYAGMPICSGAPTYLKEKFAPRYIIHVLLEEQSNEKSAASIEAVITGHVKNANLESVNGCHLRYDAPKEEQEKLKTMFAALEKEQSELGIKCVGLSVNTFEDVFLGVAEEIADQAEKPLLENVDPRASDIHQGCLAIFLQQIAFIWWMRLLSYSVTAAICQVCSTIYSLNFFK